MGSPLGSQLRALLADMRHAASVRALPPRVAWFQVRARRRARRTGDVFSLTSATRPRDLAQLLQLAAGAKRVVEIGTGTAWTSIALALAEGDRRVTTYEPFPLLQTGGYLDLVAADVQRRIKFVSEAGARGPLGDEAVDLLYIDSSHTREDTLAELRAWSRTLKAGSVVIFDDYTHPDFPGVREAIAELGLEGEQRGTLFVHRVV